MRSDDRAEQLMDAALRSYTERVEVPETRVAVARVMERALAEESWGRFSWLAWGAVAVGCLVAMGVVFAVWVTRAPRMPEIAWVPKTPGVVDSYAWTSRSVPGRSIELPRSARSKNGRDQNEVPNVLPKMAVFPTPRPLTAEEQALAAFAAQASPAAKKEVIEAERHLGDPIVIAELKIDPLEEKVRE
jgi:hypothetical protein